MKLIRLSSFAGFLAAAALALATAPEARAQTKVLVLPFAPAGGSATAEQGSTLAATLGLDLHDGVMFDVIARERAQAVARKAQPDQAKMIPPEQLLAIGQALGAAYIVYGGFLESASGVQVSVMVAVPKSRQIHKMRARGDDLAQVQVELSNQVRKLLLDGPDAVEATTVVVPLPKTAAAVAAVAEPPPPDPFAEELVKMTPEQRKKCAVEEFNAGSALGDNSDAERDHYLKAIRCNEELAEVYFNLGLLNYRRKEWESAAKHLRRFASLAPNDPAAPKVTPYIQDAEDHMAKEALTKVEVAFVPTPEQGTWSATQWFNAALKIKNDPKLAASYYLRAIMLDPQMAAAHYNLGKLYYDQNRLEEAGQAFRDYLKTAPANDPDRGAIENLLKHLPPPRDP